MTSRRDFLNAVAALIAAPKVTPELVPELPTGEVGLDGRLWFAEHPSRLIPDVNPEFVWVETGRAPFTTLMEAHERAGTGLAPVLRRVEETTDPDFCEDTEDGEHAEDCSHND